MIPTEIRLRYRGQSESEIDLKTYYEKLELSRREDRSRQYESLEVGTLVNESLYYGRKTRVFRRSHIAAVGRLRAVVDVRASLVSTLIAGLRRRWQRKNPQRKPHNWMRVGMRRLRRLLIQRELPHLTRSLLTRVASAEWNFWFPRRRLQTHRCPRGAQSPRALIRSEQRI